MFYLCFFVDASTVLLGFSFVLALTRWWKTLVVEEWGLHLCPFHEPDHPRIWWPYKSSCMLWPNLMQIVNFLGGSHVLIWYFDYLVASWICWWFQCVDFLFGWGFKVVLSFSGWIVFIKKLLLVFPFCILNEITVLLPDPVLAHTSSIEQCIEVEC